MRPVIMVIKYARNFSQHKKFLSILKGITCGLEAGGWAAGCFLPWEGPRRGSLLFPLIPTIQHWQHGRHTKSMTLIIAHHKIYSSHSRHPELNDSMRVKLRQHSQSINSYGKFPQLHTPSTHYKVLIYARRIDQCTIQISYYLICTHLCTMVQGVRKDDEADTAIEGSWVQFV